MLYKSPVLAKDIVLDMFPNYGIEDEIVCILMHSIHFPRAKKIIGSALKIHLIYFTLAIYLRIAV